jgi:hypothetical protein
MGKRNKNITDGKSFGDGTDGARAFEFSGVVGAVNRRDGIAFSPKCSGRCFSATRGGRSAPAMNPAASPNDNCGRFLRLVVGDGFAAGDDGLA